MMVYVYFCDIINSADDYVKSKGNEETNEPSLFVTGKKNYVT